MIAKKNAWLLPALVGLGLTGCGGDPEGAGGSPIVNPPPPPPPSVGRGTLVVTATDALGAPLAGATVFVSTSGASTEAITDSSGRAEVKDVIASTIYVGVSAPGAYGYAPSVTLAADTTVAVAITAMPVADVSGGIARASVPVGGVSSDGRMLEFSLRIVQVPAISEYWSFATKAVQLSACTPDAGNDAPRFRPDCVAGAEGYDASYEGSAISIKRVAATAQRMPRSTVLLLDQSALMAVDDPADARLFAAKYFMTLASEGDRTALAAFSSDQTASGQLSLLPQKPVTFLPVDRPQFSTDGRSYFSSIDALGSQEGGASPLLEAIDHALDFAAGDVQEDAKTLVVVTNGHDDTCGTRSECRARVDALVQKSKQAGVSIVTVGLGGAANDADHEMLGLLSQSTSRGAAFWAPGPDQLSTTLGEVPSLLAGRKDTLEVTFRIQSPAEGAFAPGRTVIGRVNLEVCPFDCIYNTIPFVVQIP